MNYQEKDVLVAKHRAGRSVHSNTVGDAETREIFHVDKAFICARSQFYRAKLNSKWKGGEENAVTLPEDDLEIFTTYLELVYTGKVACKEGGVTIFELQTNENSAYYDESYEPSEANDDSGDGKDSEMTAFPARR